MPFYSIIIPVYKTQNYLERCVHSVLNQDLSDFELILVDDGSPDQCPEMCDNFALSDTRVKVFHKTNGGVSSARNCGLDHATGEYVWFVDSDDYIEPYALSQMFAATQQYHTDLYIFNCKGVREEFKGKLNDFMEKYYFTYVLGFGPWNKLYCNSIIQSKKLRFDEAESIGEDLLFNLSYYQSIMGGAQEGRFFFLGRDYYTYNDRIDSAMHTAQAERIEIQLRLYRKARQCLQNSIAPNTLTYLFVLHLISGINQSKDAGLTSTRFSKIEFSPYQKEINSINSVLRSFFQNENATMGGRIRMRLFCQAMITKNYRIAGKIMGLA